MSHVVTMLRDATADHDRVLLATAAAIVTLAIVLFVFVNGAMPTYLYLGFLVAFIVVAGGILHATDISPPDELAEAAAEVADEVEDEESATDDEDAEADEDSEADEDAEVDDDGQSDADDGESDTDDSKATTDDGESKTDGGSDADDDDVDDNDDEDDEDDVDDDDAADENTDTNAN